MIEFKHINIFAAYNVKRPFSGVKNDEQLCDTIFGNTLVFCKNHERACVISDSRISVREYGVDTKGGLVQTTV